MACFYTTIHANIHGQSGTPGCVAVKLKTCRQFKQLILKGVIKSAYVQNGENRESYSIFSVIGVMKSFSASETPEC
jgi:hypothetical protein